MPNHNSKCDFQKDALQIQLLLLLINKCIDSYEIGEMVFGDNWLRYCDLVTWSRNSKKGLRTDQKMPWRGQLFP